MGSARHKSRPQRVHDALMPGPLTETAVRIIHLPSQAPPFLAARPSLNWPEPQLDWDGNPLVRRT
ncbi:MAG: hypothetical protein QOJ11_214 [Frankiales bacterium]|jgi:hypothetical protein|nr:hypothetical protein [Frankiales bacterium]